MLRGVDFSQPGWFVGVALVVPLVVLLPFVLAVALTYELVVRLDGRRRLSATGHWLLAGALAGSAISAILLLAVQR